MSARVPQAETTRRRSPPGVGETGKGDEKQTCLIRYGQHAPDALQPYHHGITLAHITEHTPRQLCGALPLPIERGKEHLPWHSISMPTMTR
jgi:hypothetical protein